MKKTVFIGSVFSSKIALEALIENNIKIDLVCSLDEKVSTKVSDYYPIHEIAKKNNVQFIKYKRINSYEIIEKIREINPNFIFVIGLSQLIPNSILNLAIDYSIGFHPTALPKYRGRAAIPWQIIMGVQNSMVSLFKLDAGMDTGDIIIQHPYQILKSDYAQDVYYKVCMAMSQALKECLINIYDDNIDFVKQNNEDATYLLIRRPEDGRIDWNTLSNDIEMLIRATSKPYPGAFTIYEGNKVIVWKARIQNHSKYIGIPGQIAWIDSEKNIGVITNDGLLIVTEYNIQNSDKNFVVGHKFS